MKIVCTGGGTGGHFYPIIAVAESLTSKAKEKKIIPPKIFYFAPTKYNPRALFDNEIEFVTVSAGKTRRYFSLLNYTDMIKTVTGIIRATAALFSVYPDVVFGKGGYASFPTLVAARLLRIPVVIHESDSTPGRVNTWAAKFAKYIAISYPDAEAAFGKKNESKIALTGNPIRKEIRVPLSNGAAEYLHLEKNVPTILILGGSTGSVTINDAVIEMLPRLVEKYQIIHQVGRANISEINITSKLVLKDSIHASRYHPYEYLDDLGMRMASGAADIVISRAGSTIFEIAAWGKPSIIIPLPETVSHDQTKNAFAYARSGACVVVEESNLSANILISEIDRIVENRGKYAAMASNTASFARLDAADKIADLLLSIGLEHES